MLPAVKQQGDPLDLGIADLHAMNIRVNDPRSFEDDLLWTLELPVFVDHLLSLSYTDANMVSPANQFLRHVIEALSQQLERSSYLPSARLKLLLAALGSHSKRTWFFTHYGQGYPEFDSSLRSEDLLLAGPVMKYITGPPSIKDACNLTSKLFYTNINSFGKEGFEYVLRALGAADEGTGRRSSLIDVADYVYLVTNLSSRLMPPFYRDYAVRFLDITFARLHAFGSSDYKQIASGGRMIETLLGNLDYFCSIVCKNYPIHEKMETFKCFQGTFLLTSQSLSLRVMGVALLTQLAQGAMNKEVTTPPLPDMIIELLV